MTEEEGDDNVKDDAHPSLLRSMSVLRFFKHECLYRYFTLFEWVQNQSQISSEYFMIKSQTKEVNIKGYRKNETKEVTSVYVERSTTGNGEKSKGLFGHGRKRVS